MSELKKIITFYPAYDKTHSDPKKNYGVHGVELKFVLKSDKGAVQFLLYTNWHLSHVQEELNRKLDSQFPHLSCHPQPADLGYHSPKPTYKGQTQMPGGCEYLDDKPCYYDGSSLNADRIYKVLLEKGSDGVWQELEEFYKEIFEESTNGKP